MATKIALTASYYDHPEVAAVLRECEVIYTTQVRNREDLEKRFVNVRFIPDSCPDTIAYLKKRHEGAEFIEFPHVFTRVYPPVKVE